MIEILLYILTALGAIVALPEIMRIISPSINVCLDSGLKRRIDNNYLEISNDEKDTDRRNAQGRKPRRDR